MTDDINTALDSIEAALQKVTRLPCKPPPDPVEHSWEAYSSHFARTVAQMQGIARDALSLIPALPEQLTPGEDVKNIWSYCPECGSKEYSVITYQEDESEERGCHDCDQIWFSDIDYTDVVRSYLENRKALQKLQAVDVERDMKNCEALSKIRTIRRPPT